MKLAHHNFNFTEPGVAIRLFSPSAALVALAALVPLVATASSCARTSSTHGNVVAIALPDRVTALSATEAAQLRATIEIPGVLGESALVISRDLKSATGTFTVDVNKATTAPFTVKLTWRPDENSDVLLARLTGTIAIAPHKDNALQPTSPFDTCGNAAPPCTLEFDLNRNGKSNLDDLAQDPSIDPRPPAPFVDVAPTDLAFPSGIQLGTLSRQVIVVENTSGHDIDVAMQLIDAPGATLAEFNPDPSAATTTAARTLPLGTLAPFDQKLVAVTFAPVNSFLTVGDVFVTATDPVSGVAQATRVRLLANVDGELQPPDRNFTAPAVPSDAGLGGFTGTVELFSTASLFNGLPITSIASDTGSISGLPSTGATITATFADGTHAIPADHAFLVDVPVDHKLAVSLAGLSSDVDLSVLVLDDGDVISTDAAKNLRSTQSGTSAEAIEVSNDSGAEQHALVVLSRVDLHAAPATPGALSSVDVVPFSLAAHVTSAPEFTKPLSPSGGPLEGGTRVTLIGKRFNPNAQITFADSLALDCTFTALPDTKEGEFDCTTPPGSLLVGKNPATIVVANPAADEGGDGQAATLPEGFTYEPPAPRLDDIVPAAAPTSGTGSSVVTLTGAFFSQRNGAPHVQFDGVDAPGVTFVDSTKITVPAPAHAAGIVVVDVLNVLDAQPDDPPGFVRLSLASNPRNFTYVTPSQPAPTLSDVSPSSGAIDGGTVVTLTGTNFLDGATVLFDGVAATNVSVPGSTSIQCTTPSHATAAAVDVEVINVDGQRATASGGYAYFIPNPTVDSAFPDTATTDGGTFVVIAGSGYRAGVSVAFVDGSGASFASPNVNRVSTTSLLAATPQVPAAGDYTLKVTNVDGNTASLSTKYHFVTASGPKPRIDSISPNTGNKDLPNVVTITGANLRAVTGSNGPAILVGSTAATVQSFDDSNANACTVTAVFPTSSSAGPVVVRLIDDDGQSDTTVYTYFTQLGAPPVIDTLSPTSAGANSAMQLVGRGFDVVDNGTGGTVLAQNARLIVGGQLVTPTNATATSLAFRVPNLDALVSGATQVAVELTNSDGQSTSATFTYVPSTTAAAPSITSVSPGVAHVGDSVTVAGSAFNLASLRLGGVVIPANSVNITSATSTSVKFTVPDPTSGGGVTLPAVLALTVTNVDGQSASTTLGVEPAAIAAPVISSIAPKTVQSAGGATVTLSGTGFSPQGHLTVAGAAVSGAVVAQNGSTVTFSAPAHADGTVAVVFTNPDGQNTSTLLSFTSTTPPPPPNAPAVITSISPSSVGVAGGTQVVLAGSNFVDAGGTLKVGGAIVAQRTVNAARTTVSFTAPAQQQAGVVVVTYENANAAAASIFLSYTTSTAATAAPTITSIDPQPAPTNGGASLTVTGTNFDGSDVVAVDGVAVAYALSSATSLSFIAPAHTAGSATVSVTNAIGAASSTVQYSGVSGNGASAPSIDQILPDNGPTAGGESVTLAGANFDATDVLTVGGNVVVPDAVSPNQITFTAPANAAATVTVRVVDVNGQSASTFFRYTDVVNGGATAVGLVSPNVLHAFVPGDAVTLTGQGLDVVGAVLIEDSFGTPIGNAVFTAPQSAVALSLQITTALPDTAATGVALQFRLFDGNGKSVAVSPAFTTARPTVTATFGDPHSSSQVIYLGDHFDGALAVAAQLGDAATGTATSIALFPSTDTVLSTGPYPAPIPGKAGRLQVVYRDIFSGGTTPPVDVINAPNNDEASIAILGPVFDEPLPANQILAGVGVLVDTASPTAPFGAPTVAHVVDAASGQDVATGAWSIVGTSPTGGDRALLTLSSTAPVAPGTFAVRLETTVSPAVAQGGALAFAARSVASLVPTAIHDGGPLGGTGTIFAGDRIVAEDTATSTATVIGSSTSLGCTVAVRGCAFTGAFEIPATSLTDGSFRICAIGPDDAVACPSSPSTVTVTPFPVATDVDYGAITGCTTDNIDHAGDFGASRGDIAAGTQFSFYTGQTQTAKFDATTLAETLPGAQVDSFFIDPSTNRVWTFFNQGAQSEPFSGNGVFTIDSLAELDPVSLFPTANVTPLSTPIVVDTSNSSNAVFAGDDLVVLFVAQSSHYFGIDIATGVVTDVGQIAPPPTQACAGWASFGAARILNGHVLLDYVAPGNAIHTFDLTTQSDRANAQFTSLDDMCSIAYVPEDARFYWHSTNANDFAATVNNFGFCQTSNAPPPPSCGDGVCKASPIAGNVPKVPANIAANVPSSETNGYRVVYDLDIPNNGTNNTTPTPYSIDDSGFVPRGSFDRIAYYLEIAQPGGPTQFIWVSTEAFTENASQIGVPTFQSGAVFQQLLLDTNVFSNVVANRIGSTTTNIEFWPNNYESADALGLGADNALFDFGDTRDTSGDYGSMQIHDFGAKQTLFAYNNWNTGATSDVGIGNNPFGGQPDYTFQGDAPLFSLKHLQVLVHQVDGEDFSSCNLDCAAVCGDGLCDGPVENDVTCPADCATGGGVRILPP